jgi:hypothetical protein
VNEYRAPAAALSSLKQRPNQCGLMQLKKKSASVLDLLNNGNRFETLMLRLAGAS